MIKYLLLAILLKPYSDSSTYSSSQVENLDSYSNTSKALLAHAKLFDNTKPFTILSYNKGIDRYTTDTDTSKCRSWKLKPKNISSIIKNSSPIDGTTWDLSFSVLTCVIEGKILQEKQEFKFAINAASFFTITNSDTTIIYGDYHKLDRKYFLSSPDDSE